MLRRIVSLLLVPCLLLTQSAGIGHSHGSSQPPGHDLRPHVHANFFSAVSRTPHRCYDGGCDYEITRSSGSVVFAAHLPEPVSDHDSDAIYVSHVNTLPDERSPAGEDGGLSGTALAADDKPKGWGDVLCSCPVCSLHPPPGFCPPSCPIYVRHLALLI